MHDVLLIYMCLEPCGMPLELIFDLYVLGGKQCLFINSKHCSICPTYTHQTFYFLIHERNIFVLILLQIKCLLTHALARLNFKLNDISHSMTCLLGIGKKEDHVQSQRNLEQRFHIKHYVFKLVLCLPCFNLLLLLSMMLEKITSCCMGKILMTLVARREKRMRKKKKNCW